MSEHKCKVAVVGGAGTWGRHYLRAYAERSDCEVTLVDKAGARARDAAGARARCMRFYGV